MGKRSILCLGLVLAFASFAIGGAGLGQSLAQTPSIPGIFNRIAVGDFDGDGVAGAVMSFPGLGVWIYKAGTWAQISADQAEELVAVYWGLEEHKIVGDSGTLGLWLWGSPGSSDWDGSWTQLSAADPEYMIAPGCGDRVFVDFGPLGLWEYDGSAWVQLSGEDPDNLVSGDFDGDGHNELMVDFGTHGVWIWDEAVWTQISPYNPD